MTETLYVNGVVIPNGLKDHEGDILTKTDIKKIFTKYIDRDTDTMHTRIKNRGVTVLANWISEVDTVIDGKTAPAGSWLATLQITNDEIIKSIKEGRINGLSLGSVSDVALTQKYWFINKSINYKDLEDMEEVVPLFISLVDKPSNQFGLEVMDYNVYINKRADNMVDTPEKKEEMIPVSFVEKLMDKLSINKAEKTADDEPAKKEDEPKKLNDEEFLNQIESKVENGVISAFKKIAESKKEDAPAKDDPEINKSENVDEPAVDEPEDDEEEVDETQDDETEKPVDDVEINKRATTKTENIDMPNKTTNFYSQSGRDEFGCRIRK